MQAGNKNLPLGERLILRYLNKTFCSCQVAAKTLIRVTSNADIDTDNLYDEDLDYRDFIERLYLNLTQDENRAAEIILKYEPERINTYILGLVILRIVVDVYGCKSICVSRYGIREGYLLSEIIKR